MFKNFMRSQQKLHSLTFKPKFCYFNQQPQNFDPAKDYYKILGLKKGADDAQIKKSYYKLAKQYHPDVNKGYETKFKEISEAYEVLSNQKTKQQYESARTFREGWSNMGSKARQGQYSSAFNDMYQGMSAEEQQAFQRQAKARLKKIGIAFGGLVFLWILFSRTPHRAYTEFNGELVPIDNFHLLQNPQQMAQNPGYPYGQPNNPYAGQMYQPPGPFPIQNQPYQPAVAPQVQPYGSQYPQSQYIPRQNDFTHNQPVSGYPQQQYGSIPQQKSQYTIDRPQPHQPYPNSHYAEKPIQSNYQPGFEGQAPKGMSD